MKVLLYSGLNKLIEKSGVGVAVEHQKQTLSDLGIDYTTSSWEEHDLVQINTVLPNAYIAGKLAKLKKVPVVYYAHSTMEDFRNSFVLSNFLAPFFKRWITTCYNTSDIIVTPTEYSKQLLESYNTIDKPIVSLSNGIDTKFYKKNKKARDRFRKKYDIPKDKKVVISVGHTIERKGISDFIDIAKNFPDVDFYWFGYTKPSLVPQNIKDKMKNASTNVKFAGFVDRENLRDAYQGSDVFLFLSHEETEGIVVLEALASEVPILVRDIPVYENWLLDGENVYKAKTKAQFEITLREMLNGEKKDLTKQGLLLAKERDLSSIGRKLKDIYVYCEKSGEAEGASGNTSRIDKARDRKSRKKTSAMEFIGQRETGNFEGFGQTGSLIGRFSASSLLRKERKGNSQEDRGIHK